MPRVRGAAPARPLQPAARAVPAATPASVADGRVAARAALAPLAWGEGPRIGILGDSGTGKTHAARFIVSEYSKTVLGYTVIVDDKGSSTSYAGDVRRDLAEFASKPPAAPPSVTILRGSIYEGETIDPETVAAWQWQMAARRWKTLGVYDELTRACGNGTWRVKHSQVARALREGRSVGLATLWLTQLPQDVPREAFHETPVILCFRLDSTALYGDKMRPFLDGGVDQVIRALPADDVPPADRGKFVVLRRGRPWDRLVYRFLDQP